MDKIFIKNLKINCIIGILPHERLNKQTIVLNVKVGTETIKAANSKSLNDTIDYAKLADNINQLTVSGKYLLLETMAEDIAQLILNDPLANNVKIKIEKTEAVVSTTSVGVEIYRARK